MMVKKPADPNRRPANVLVVGVNVAPDVEK
jgi:hypothetical protein